ncbi:MAG: TRAP transporter TatT component family protein [Spirochaetia bacterium]|nr:TRAP transporter TatT component family protein [Spirochaetia bacterium]
MFIIKFTKFSFLALLIGCSLKKMTANMVADSLTGESLAFVSDEDPELIKEALPFGLKTYESLLETTPEHEGLLLSAAMGFTSYAYLLNNEADEIDSLDYKKAKHLRKRSSRLFLRGRNYAMRGIELKHKNFSEDLIKKKKEILAETDKEEAAFLYWAGVSWAGAISADKGNAKLIADLPVAGALVERVLKLDDTFDEGAAYEFLIAYEAARPQGDLKLAREYYEKALNLSGGQRASVYLNLAESVSVKEQNMVEFNKLIDLALAVKTEEYPKYRLVNTISQNRAIWLKKNISNLFFEAD